MYGNLQRDRGLRAVLEAVIGTLLLFKLQPRLGLLFSVVIPSVATITVRCALGSWWGGGSMTIMAHIHTPHTHTCACSQARLGRRLTRTVLAEGQALAKENGAALEVVRNIREVRFAGVGSLSMCHAM